jgi:4-amino-4-deoxy-L-arabinose transferase-like glycosyltransferase
LLAVISVATCLRFRNLTELELCHWDEGAYTAGPFGTGTYATAATAPLYAPPLYPILVHAAFALFSLHAWAAIAVAALAGVLTVLALYALAREVAGPWAALGGAALLAVSPYHLIFSRLALTDSLFLLWFILALHAWILSLTRGGGFAVLSGVLAGLATWTKYPGPLVLVIGVALALLAHWWARDGDRVGLRTIAVRAGQALLVLVPFGLGLAVYLSRTAGLAAWLEHRSRWTVGLHLWSIKQTAITTTEYLTSWVPWPILATAAVGAVLAVKRRSFGDLVWLVWLALYAGSLVMYQNFPRLPLPLVPPIAMLAAVGALGLARAIAPARSSGAVAALVTVVLLATSAPPALEQTRVHTRAYAEAADYLRRNARPGARILLLAQPCVLFYLPGRTFEVYTRSHGDEEQALELLRSGRFDFLVTDQRLLYTPEFNQFLADHRDRFTLAASFPNPAPEAVLLDRLAFAQVKRVASDPALEPARKVQIFQPKPVKDG